MSSPEVRAAGECKNLTLFNLYYLCRASFSPPHSRVVVKWFLYFKMHEAKKNSDTLAL